MPTSISHEDVGLAWHRRGFTQQLRSRIPLVDEGGTLESNQPRHDRMFELRHAVGELCNLFHAEVQALGAEGVEKHRDVCQREALRYVERPVVFGHNSRRQSLSQLHLLLEQLREWLAQLSQRDEPTLRLEEHINSFCRT